MRSLTNSGCENTEGTQWNKLWLCLVFIPLFRNYCVFKCCQSNEGFQLSKNWSMKELIRLLSSFGSLSQRLDISLVGDNNELWHNECWIIANWLHDTEPNITTWNQSNGSSKINCLLIIELVADKFLLHTVNKHQFHLFTM